MSYIKKLVCVFSFLLLFSTTIVNASTVDDISNENNKAENTRPVTDEEIEAIKNDKYLEYVVEKDLKEGDEIISTEQSYFRVNEENQEVTKISKEDYNKEMLGIKLPELGTRGYKPGDSISVPDKWNWITLKMYTIKLATPIHNNKYQFTASYRWKYQPNIVAGKDVFGIANDGNIVFDTTTMKGQSIVPTIANPYGEVTDYSYVDEDVIEEVSGVAFKHQLAVSVVAKQYPLGSISVCGNNSASSGTIGVTYAHSQITGSYDVSISKEGASINVKPALSFDTIRTTAAIDF